MTHALNEEETMLVDTVRTFIDRDVKPTVREVEHANEYPEAWIEQMKRVGIFGLAVPEEYGGSPVSMPCYVKVTEDTVLVPLTLQIRNRDITFNTKDGVAKGEVNVLGRVATITDHVVQTFEQTLEVEEPSELLGKALDQASVHWWALPLKPGRYRVDIAIKDVNNPDHVGTWAEGIVVPKYDDEKLSASSLILADKMEQVPTKQIGTGQFILGNTYVRPRVSSGPAVAVTFHRSQKLNFWMQVYNLAIDDKSKQNAATIQYQIMDMASNKAILDTSETSAALGDNSANSDQLTVRRSVPLSSLQPGKYQVTITVNDHVSKQQVAQSAPFTVD